LLLFLLLLLCVLPLHLSFFISTLCHSRFLPTRASSEAC
jgi:hypothetical protein